jgi:hypothetical protein
LPPRLAISYLPVFQPPTADPATSFSKFISLEMDMSYPYLSQLCRLLFPYLLLLMLSFHTLLATQSSNSSMQATTTSSGPGPGAQSSKNADAAKTDGAANRLNVNATSFRPNPKGLVFTPVISYRYCPGKVTDAFHFHFRLHRTRLWVHQRTRHPHPRPSAKVYIDFFVRCMQTTDLPQTFL